MAFLRLMIIRCLISLAYYLAMRVDSYTSDNASGKRLLFTYGLLMSFFIFPFMPNFHFPYVYYLFFMLSSGTTASLWFTLFSSINIWFLWLMHILDMFSFRMRYAFLPARLSMVKQLGKLLSTLNIFIVVSPVEGGLICITAFVLVYLCN